MANLFQKQAIHSIHAQTCTNTQTHTHTHTSNETQTQNQKKLKAKRYLRAGATKDTKSVNLCSICLTCFRESNSFILAFIFSFN